MEREGDATSESSLRRRPGNVSESDESDGETTNSGGNSTSSPDGSVKVISVSGFGFPSAVSSGASSAADFASDSDFSEISGFTGFSGSAREREGAVSVGFGLISIESA